MTRTERTTLIQTAISYCERCDCLLTEADDQMGCCTQCEARLPALRRLLVKVGKSYINDPGTSDLYDEQPVSVSADLGDVRLAWRLLR